MIVIPKEIELKNDTYYFECCAGLGDTMLTCGYMDALLEKYQAPIRLIVKPSHAFIPEMYDIDDILVLGNSMTENFIRKHTKSTPQKGKIYAASPNKHPEMWDYFKPMYYLTLTVRYIPWFRTFLELNEGAKLRYPLHYPKLGQKVEQQCLRLAPLDEIVLFSPEATSTASIPSSHWNNLYERLSKEGYTIISNVVNKANTIPGTVYIPMSSSDAVALAMQCDSVHSVRSGFCDPIFKKGSKLHVYHSSHNSFFIFELNEMYPGFNIDEQIVLHE